MVYGIYEDREGDLWVYTHSAGFNLFDKITKKFQRFTLNERKGHAYQDWLSNTIVDIVQDYDDSNILWISGGRIGVFRFEKNTQRFSKIDLPPVASNGSPLYICLLYTSPSPRDATLSRMPSSA